MIRAVLCLSASLAAFLTGCSPQNDETAAVKVVNNSVYHKITHVIIRSGEHGIVVNRSVSINNGDNKLFENLPPAADYKVALTDGWGSNYTTKEFGLEPKQTRTVTYYYRNNNPNAEKYGLELRSER